MSLLEQEVRQASSQNKTQKHPVANKHNLVTFRNVFSHRPRCVKPLENNYLEFSGHANNIMIWRVVLVAVRKHQSDVCGELLSVTILSAVHFPLHTREENILDNSHIKTECAPTAVLILSTLMVPRSIGCLIMSW